MHQIHTTPGFIIDSRSYGEAGKILSIYTKDLGLVFATAQGIRLERSKLRYHTNDYSFGRFSLVRGKEYWRLTSAQETEGRKSSCAELVARLAFLLKRLLHGEEPNVQLFECISATISFLESSPQLTDEQMRTLESITVARMLHALGYIGNDAELADTFKENDLTIGLLDSSVSQRKNINQHINKALKESQL